MPLRLTSTMAMIYIACLGYKTDYPCLGHWRNIRQSHIWTFRPMERQKRGQSANTVEDDLFFSSLSAFWTSSTIPESFSSTSMDYIQTMASKTGAVSK